MICQICKINVSKIIVYKTTGIDIEKIYLCNLCASKILRKTMNSFSISIFEKNKEFKNMSNSFKKNSLDNAKNNFKHSVESQEKCSGCGTEYSEFLKTGKLGCSQCYKDFKRQLFPIIKRLHGHLEHKGKIPVDVRGNIFQKESHRERIDNIKRRLQKAILLEDYEKAAELRDLIYEAEKGLNNGRE